MNVNKEIEPRVLNSSNRRDFIKLCSSVAAVLGLGVAGTTQVAEALTGAQKTPVLWLHFVECTGCTESFLRTMNPWADELLLDLISLDYHETLMAGAGAKVHEALLHKAEEYKGEFFCVVEGSIPTAENGIYGTVAGRTMLSIAQEVCPKAKAVLNIGTCSSYGGLAAASPNPTGAMGVSQALPNLTIPVVNIPGCPPNPINFVSVIASYQMQGSLPALDSKGRPIFAYGESVHEHCPYDDDEQHCLEDEGCKGHDVGNNCTTLYFNDGTSFPMKAGHPCVGCSEPSFWDVFSPFFKELPDDDKHDDDDHHETDNTAPRFSKETITLPRATMKKPYEGSVSSYASDADGDQLDFSIVSGPAWLEMSANGKVQGTPRKADRGINVWKIKVRDGNGGRDTAQLEIKVRR